MLTMEEVKNAVPPQLRNAVSQDLVDKLNLVSSDQEAAAAIRDTFVGFTTVLKEGKFKLEDYLNAAAFVSYRMMGFNNQESYARTFPQRYQGLVARGATPKDISAYVSIYARGKLVNLILEQAMIPVWVMNQDAFQKAVTKQVELMNTARSEMVQMQAANSILTHVKPPEKKQIDVNVTTPEASGLNELRQMLGDIAQRQIQLIESGATTREIAHQKLISNGAAMIDVTPSRASE
ncbi:MAG: hypothetical protein ACT4OK_11085 [Gemmobacter sp.]